MIERLTATERAVADLVATGAPTKEIARALHMSEQRVKNTLTSCFRRLDLDPARNPRVLLALAVARDAGGVPDGAGRGE